jgi:hypothetical protein
MLTAGALGVAAFAVPNAQAASFNVTNLNDGGAGSLRDAISQANATAGADVITFQSGLTGTIALTTGQLDIRDSLDIQGPGAAALAVSGSNASRVFYLYSNSALLDISISGLTIRDGAASVGAGIADFNENLTLDGVTLQNNVATGDGGGLMMDGFDFSFTIRNTTITGNTASGDGGGIYIEDTNDDGVPNLIEDSIISGNQARRGGGIYLYDPDSPITIDRTTISDNTANQTGGGLHLQDTDTDGTFTITNSTISGNSAATGGGVYFYEPDNPVLLLNTTISGNEAASGNGGGVYFYNLYDTSLQFVTVVSNQANGSGGGLHVEQGTADLTNSIVADNTAVIDSDLGGPGDLDTTSSLIEVASASMNDNGDNLTGVDPQLGPLADNGGPTETHLPDPGSPVIDAANLGLTPGVTADQRGTTRPAGTAADMGAVELSGGTIAFSSATYSVDEDDGTVTLTVTRTGDTDPATVDYATAGGSATSGSDFTPDSGTLTFAAGQTSQSIILGILDDAATEGPETFTVTLSNPSAATLGAPSEATVTVADVENGTIQFSSATYSVNENGGSLTVTVVRTGGSDGTVTVNYATSNGTANAGSDYTATTGTLTFLPGDTSETFNVPILPDAVVEGDETFNLTLTTPTGGAVIGSPATAVATIVDAPVAAIAAVPIFDNFGRFFALVGSALAGLYMMTRKRLFGLFLALLFIAAATPSLFAAPAQQRHVKEEKAEKVRGTIASVTTTEAGTIIALKDGRSITLAKSTVVRDARGNAKQRVAVTALRAEQNVIIRTTRQGNVVKIVP